MTLLAWIVIVNNITLEPLSIIYWIIPMSLNCKIRLVEGFSWFYLFIGIYYCYIDWFWGYFRWWIEGLYLKWKIIVVLLDW